MLYKKISEQGGQNMMNVMCENCGKKYKINEARITGESLKVKCKACGEAIKIVKPQPEEISEADIIYDTSVPSESKMSETKTVGKAFPFVGNKVGKNPSPSPAIKRAEKATTGVGWKNSIQTTISGILILLTTAILLGFVLFNYFAAKSQMNEELKHFSEITSTRLSQYLVEALWGVEEKQIEDSLNSEMMEKRIYAIVIYDRDTKTIFLGKKRDNNWNIISAKGKISGKFLKSRKKITRGKETIGDVEVYVASKFMEEELFRSVINIVITAIVLNIAIFFAVFVAFRKIIIQPIMKLTDAAERMSVGDLNVEIDIKSKNEVGLLAEAIERMQTSLRLAMDRLRRKR
jgi:predicted Zn finger-like uncharacterized protein